MKYFLLGPKDTEKDAYFESNELGDRMLTRNEKIS